MNTHVSFACFGAWLFGLTNLDILHIANVRVFDSVETFGLCFMFFCHFEEADYVEVPVCFSEHVLIVCSDGTFKLNGQWTSG